MTKLGYIAAGEPISSLVANRTTRQLLSLSGLDPDADFPGFIPIGSVVTGGGGGLTWKDVWNSATAYNVNDVVSLSGSSYVCILANTNHTPPNATYWSLMASAGTNGVSGSDGAAGATGASGAAGQGVPTGGTAGQVLSKIDGTNYNTQWVAPGGGGTIAGLTAGKIPVASNATTVIDSGLSDDGTTISSSRPLALARNVVTQPQFKDTSEVVNALGNVTGAVTVDHNLGDLVSMTLTGNVTLTFTNVPPTGQAASFALLITGDGVHGVTYPAGWDFGSGGTPPIPPNAKVQAVVGITLNNGTNFLAAVAGSPLPYGKQTGTIVTGVLTVDYRAGAIVYVALNANITSIVITNWPASGIVGVMFFRFTNDGTVRTVAWPAGALWFNHAGAPAMSGTNGYVDWVQLISADALTTYDATPNKGYN